VCHSFSTKTTHLSNGHGCILINMKAEVLSLQDAADELGVHYMTAYRYVRLGKLIAEKSGGVWEVLRSDLDDLIQSGGQQPAAKSTKRWDEQLLAVLLAGDEGAAWQVVESALASGREPSAIYSEMISPALREIGNQWERGEIDVVDEHRASQIATRIVGRLSPRFHRRGRPKGTFIVAAAPGDFHTLAVMMLSDQIRGAGYHTIDLGGAVPVESLRRAAAETQSLSAIAISAFRPDNEAEIRAAIAAARTATDVPIILGGPAIDGPNHAKGLGATAYAEDVDDALVALISHET